MEIASLHAAVTMDSSGFQQGVGRVQGGSRRLQSEFSRMGAAADQAGAAISRMGQQGRMGGTGLTNVAFQVQDFAVQVGSGTDAARALSQQLPQLLSGFGLLGAVAGTAAAVLLPLGGYLLGIGSAAEEAADQITSLRASVDAYVDSAREATRNPFELAEDYGISIVQARELLEIRRELNRLDAERDLLGFSGAVSGITGDFRQFSASGASGLLRERLDLLAQLEQAQRDSDAAWAAGDAAGIARASDIAAALTRSLNTTDLLGRKVSELANTLELAPSAASDLAVALAAVDDSTDPREQAASWRSVREELIEAAGGIELLNSEGVELLNLTMEAEDAALRMAAALGETAGVDLARPFRDAIGPAGELRGIIAESLSTLQGWGGAIGDFVGSFAPDADLARSLAGMTDGVAAASALIRQKEGFRETPYWDVNALRAGYGSDTVTLSDGSIRAITAGMTVSRADAERDLQRRISTEFMPAAARAVGEDLFGRLSSAQQAVLTSLAYNYGAGAFGPSGSLAGVADAVRSGSAAGVAAAIRGLGGDNGGINRDRRNAEAALYAAGPVLGVGDAEAGAAAATQVAQEAAEAEREREQAIRDRAQAQAEALRLDEQAKSVLDSLVASIDPAAAEAQKLAQAQEAVNNAVARGIITQAEGASILESYRLAAVMASEEMTAAIEATQAAQEAAAEQFQSTWGAAVEGVADWIASGFEGGFDTVRDLARNLIRDLLRQFLQAKFVIPIQLGLQAGLTGGALPASGPGSGIMGMIGKAMGGFGAGFGSVFSGFASGGFGGAMSAIGTALSGATSGFAGLMGAIGAIAAPLAVVGGLFAAFKKKVTLLDEGLNITIKGLDVAVATFKKTETSQFFGLIKKTKTSTEAAPDSIAKPIEDAYLQIRKSTLSMAQVLGASARRLTNFSTSFKLSLKDMTEDQKVRAIEAELERIGDNMAKRLLPGIMEFAELGESASDALTRLSSALLGANEAMKSLGFTTYRLGLQGADAASKFVQVFGTVEDMARGVGFYLDNFYTQEERTADATRRLSEGMAKLGLRTIPATHEEFRALVDQIAASGNMVKAGGLIKLAPIFDEIRRAADALADSLNRNDFASRFDYEREVGLARWRTGTGVPLVTVPTAAPASPEVQQIAALQAEVAAMRSENRQLLLAIEQNTNKTASTQNKWDKVGLPREQAA